MKLIVGLGNPGPKYENTRHNVGYKVVSALQNQELPRDVVVKKTNVYMNESGRAVKTLSAKFKVQSEKLYVVHDDLDILLGQFKIQLASGPKVHNGVNSVEEALGIDEFWRVRVGVENRLPSIERRVQGREYVLQDFTPEEKAVIDQVVMDVVQAVIQHVQRFDKKKI